MKKKLFMLLIVGSVAFAGECTRDNANETVNCTDSGLMWQDDSNAKTTEKNWQGAIDHCEGLDFAGHDDWRLPNRNELISIVNYEKSSGANIKNSFANTSSRDYWSSTSYASDSGDAWAVEFANGHDGWTVKSYSFYVRCVRAGQ